MLYHNTMLQTKINPIRRNATYHTLCSKHKFPGDSSVGPWLPTRENYSFFSSAHLVLISTIVWVTTRLLVVHCWIIIIAEDGIPSIVVFWQKFFDFPVVLFRSHREFKIFSCDGIPVLNANISGYPEDVEERVNVPCKSSWQPTSCRSLQRKDRPSNAVPPHRWWY